MNVNGKPYRSIWLADDGWSVEIIDQTRLPHEFVTVRLTGLEDAADAIRNMQVRGAPLIGATAAYGVCLALHRNASNEALEEAGRTLLATRPTAINLHWAIQEMRSWLEPLSETERVRAAYQKAGEICDEDVQNNRAIGDHGVVLLEDIYQQRRTEDPLNILTHCNAGWLATVDWGTALAPIYLAHDRGMPLHVWVDETRPRNQGASLTAWELLQHGVPHTVIVDSTGGHLMQRGLVDCCITGCDRTTASGDVCNKIGTYLKALAARDNGVPFLVALPGPTIDWSITDGLRDIPIEQRDGREVSHIEGLSQDGTPQTLQLTPEGSPVANYAFDITPACLVTALITERGVCEASKEGLHGLYHDAGSS
ncbi:MAG: S-methyl-5-thioribose-1-phosphate isomerase [Planctomycetes bacterium]|nr:S-methyl-5-thioribose-1-phosphate isomerase [Planctomycetota bacterium]